MEIYTCEMNVKTIAQTVKMIFLTAHVIVLV